MNKFFKQLSKNYYSSFLGKPFFYISLFVFSACVITYMFFVGSLIYKNTAIYRMFEGADLKNHIVYYDTIGCEERFFSSDLFSLPNTLSSVEGVESATYFSNGGIYLWDGYEACDVQDYSSVSYNYPFDLIEGNNPSKGSKNEAIIPESLSSRYSVGDTIIFKNIEGYNDVVLEVVGIYSDETLLLHTNRRSNPPVLTNRFIEYEVYKERGNPPVIITYNLIDVYGNEIIAPSYYSIDIKIESGYSQETVKKNIQEVVFDDYNVVTYDDMVINYRKQFSSEQKQNITFLAISLILLVSTIFTNVANEYQNDHIEYKVKYLCGMSWKKCIWFEFINVMFIAGLSVIPAYFFVRSKAFEILGKDIVSFSLRRFIFASLIYLFLLSIVNIWIYLRKSFLTPEELIIEE